MNPSASGWVAKHLRDLQQEKIEFSHGFYEELRRLGFLYANSLASVSYPQVSQEAKWTIEENTKVNLLDALWNSYAQHQLEIEGFVPTCIQFYEQLENQHEASFFKRSLFKLKPVEKLEKIIQQRIQTSISLVQKNFSNLLTNALLYIDVLAFEHYLQQPKEDSFAYAQHLEALITNTVLLAFEKKAEPSPYEKLIHKLLESSLRYNKINDTFHPFEALNFNRLQTENERKYVLDLACISVYSDVVLEASEYSFLLELGEKLGFRNERILQSITAMLQFIETHQHRIAYFNQANALKHFYNNTNRMVKLLIIRNRKRLLVELSESKELVVLLSKSTHAELTGEEKQKVKNQLLDICKSVPSLAIFILPGGSVLLPILIKFIPQLLPSAFQENQQK